ncbi:rbcL [Symbiodinium natans]|uniref:RbcL protein n=1 Tax=Symbiodinium natans TaxID=878477 RepID=A0A812L487_9DINO|nr:rbcL [Symbiodinium natans]
MKQTAPIIGGMNALRLPAFQNLGPLNVIWTPCGSFHHQQLKAWKSGQLESAKTQTFLSTQKDVDQIYQGWKEQLGYTNVSSAQTPSSFIGPGRPPWTSPAAVTRTASTCRRPTSRSRKLDDILVELDTLLWQCLGPWARDPTIKCHYSRANLGNSHPDTLKRIFALPELLERCGRLTEPSWLFGALGPLKQAELLFREELELCRGIYGATKETLNWVGNLTKFLKELQLTQDGAAEDCALRGVCRTTAEPPSGRRGAAAMMRSLFSFRAAETEELRAHS